MGYGRFKTSVVVALGIVVLRPAQGRRLPIGKFSDYPVDSMQLDDSKVNSDSTWRDAIGAFRQPGRD